MEFKKAFYLRKRDHDLQEVVNPYLEQMKRQLQNIQ